MDADVTRLAVRNAAQAFETFVHRRVSPALSRLDLDALAQRFEIYAEASHDNARANVYEYCANQVRALLASPAGAGQAGEVRDQRPRGGADLGKGEMNVREYVAGFAFAKNVHGDHVVALVLKKRPHWQVGKWNGIGGHVEAGETPIAAMSREFQEEAHAFVGEPQWEHFATLEDDRAIKDAGAWRVYWFRTVLSVIEAQQVRTHGDEEVAWHLVDRLPATIPNLHWLIPLASERQRHDWPLHIRERRTIESLLCEAERIVQGEKA